MDKMSVCNMAFFYQAKNNFSDFKSYCTAPFVLVILDKYKDISFSTKKKLRFTKIQCNLPVLSFLAQLKDVLFELNP